MPRFQHLAGHGKHTHHHRDGRRELSVPGHILTVEHGDDLGAAIRKFVQLDPDPPEPVYAHAELEMRKRGTRGPWWDVVRKDTGKPVNDRALTEADARELLTSWSPESASGDGQGFETDPPGPGAAAGGALGEPQSGHREPGTGHTTATTT